MKDWRMDIMGTEREMNIKSNTPPLQKGGVSIESRERRVIGQVY